MIEFDPTDVNACLARIERLEKMVRSFLNAPFCYDTEFDDEKPENRQATISCQEMHALMLEARELGLTNLPDWPAPYVIGELEGQHERDDELNWFVEDPARDEVVNRFKTEAKARAWVAERLDCEPENVPTID